MDKLICISQMYNESTTGNLIPFMESVIQYCDDIVVYDDGSTDDSVEVASKYTSNIIEGKENNWGNEAQHRQIMLERAVQLNASWVWWVDQDEVIEAIGECSHLRDLMCYDNYDSWAFHEINLWRSPAFYRLDNAYNDGWYCRLWRVHSGIKIPQKLGLHQRLVPEGLKSEGRSDLQVIHYGFSSDERILNKYHTYKAHGQSGWPLNRLVDERTLRVAPSNPEWFDYKLPDVKPRDVYKIPLVSKIK